MKQSQQSGKYSVEPVALEKCLKQRAATEKELYIGAQRVLTALTEYTPSRRKLAVQTEKYFADGHGRCKHEIRTCVGRSM